MIFEEKFYNTMVELGVYLFTEDVGYVNDTDYILNNKGQGK